MKKYKQEWFGNVKGDLLAGIVVCMALIPEAIGFSIVAGVDPMVGVYASFVLSVTTAFLGGRPGLITAAAGATALVLASLVANYGMEYLFAATILTGVIQLIFSFLKIGNLMKFIPKPVMVGFVNALGIMMFKSQLSHFEGGGILFVLAGIGIAIIYLFPKITKKVPSPIIAIITITIIVVVFKIDIKTLGDMGEISTTLPSFSLPSVPINLETLRIILPYSVSVALVGIVESLLTSQLVDELTDTKSDKNRECFGQGFANMLNGCFGGIAGCGMIGQTIINNNYGGRGRLSTFVAGSSMLISVIVFNRYVVQIPVIALASVMVVVSFSTFNWKSVKRIRSVPKTDTLVMLSTVVVVLMTDNLAYGVILGIIISSVVFVAKNSTIEVEKVEKNNNLQYILSGPLFFASTSKLISAFEYSNTYKNIDIDFSKVKIWDESAVDAIDKIITRYANIGVTITLLGLSQSSKDFIKGMTVSQKEHIIFTDK
ncbi:MAG: SulP family inorganic anion transporter [Clostridia bacterium]